MSFSSGFATALAGSRMETTLLFNPSSSSSSSSSALFMKGVQSQLGQQIRVACKPNRNERNLQQSRRGVVRCEVAVDPSSASALEQLKASAPDRT